MDRLIATFAEGNHIPVCLSLLTSKLTVSAEAEVAGAEAEVAGAEAEVAGTETEVAGAETEVAARNQRLRAPKIIDEQDVSFEWPELVWVRCVLQLSSSCARASYFLSVKEIYDQR